MKYKLTTQTVTYMLAHYNVDQVYILQWLERPFSHKIPFYIYTRPTTMHLVQVMSYNECRVQHMLGNASSSEISTTHLLINIIQSQYMV